MYDVLLAERDALRGQLDELLSGVDDDDDDGEPTPVEPSKVLEPAVRDITFSASESKQDTAPAIPLTSVYSPSEAVPESRPSILARLRGPNGPVFQSRLAKWLAVPGHTVADFPE